MRGLILALDLAANCGFCGGDSKPGARPALGSVRLAPGGNLAARGCALIDWLDDFHDFFDPWLIVYEAPLMSGRHNGNAAARSAHGLGMAVEMYCFRRGIRCAEGHMGQTRKAVLGRGNATKDDMEAACRAAGLDPPDQDASDAWGVWRFACMVKGDVRPIPIF